MSWIRPVWPWREHRQNGEVSPKRNAPIGNRWLARLRPQCARAYDRIAASLGDYGVAGA